MLQFQMDSTVESLEMEIEVAIWINHLKFNWMFYKSGDNNNNN